MSGPRFAIYFVPAPETALFQFGSSVIGYDCYARHQTKFPPNAPLTTAGWMQVTEAPRRYGFHATLKAPFYLARESDVADLPHKLRAYAKSMAAIPSIRIKPAVLDDFVALVPSQLSPALENLARECVVVFDDFRAPLKQEERQRRLSAGLSLRQAGNLERWGYPYVFDDFRFHMTLTGALGEADRSIVFDYLRQLFDRAKINEVAVDRLCLVRQDWPGAAFHVTHQIRLG